MLYITEGIHAIANNSANAFGGITLTKRYAELVDVKEETRTEEEVRAYIEEKLRAL